MKEKQITKSQARVNAIMAILHLIVYFAIALGVWGLALEKSILWFGLGGAVAGLLIGLLFVAPVVSSQRSGDRTKEMMFAVGAIWGFIALSIGILGIIVWIIRLVFT